MKKRSQAVQRELPRPLDVNHTVLRPMGKDDPPLAELQKVILSQPRTMPTSYLKRSAVLSFAMFMQYMYILEQILLSCIITAKICEMNCQTGSVSLLPTPDLCTV